MAIGWDESSVKRDYHGRFARFESGSIPSPDYLAPNEIDSVMPDAYPNDLSQRERMALRFYAGLDGDIINAHLREQDLDPGEQRQAEGLTGEIDALMERHATPEDLWVTRVAVPEAFGGKEPDELVGSTFEDAGFMSTTLYDDTPAELSKDKSKYPVVMRLKVPKGTPSYYVQGLPSVEADEQELLLGRGRQFDLTGVRQTSDGRWEVFGEVRPEEETQDTQPDDTPSGEEQGGTPEERITSTVDDLSAEFPMVDISEVRPVEEGDDIPPSAHMGHKEGVVVFNPDKMTDAGLKEVEEQQEQGFLLKTDAGPVEYLATHEFGHSIGGAINAGASDPDTFEEYMPIQAAYAKVLRSDAKPPSKYSKTNRKEAFAEAFADYMLNPPEKHSALTKEVGEVVEMLKRVSK